MNYFLGLDVGGTNLAAGVVDENCRIIGRAAVPAGAGRSIEEIIADMAAVSLAAVKNAGLTPEQMSSWGIGMPSCVNPGTGLLVHANCFGWHNVPIYSYLDKYMDLPIYMENDANCAVLGETLAGAARGHRNVLMLTLGTGVGGGIVLDGRIYCGADLMGAELGHTKLIYRGRQCSCGQRGCLDEYCSARGLVQTAREKIRPDSRLWEMCSSDLAQLDSRMVFEAMQAGDESAAAAWDEYVEELGSAIGNFVVVFRPEIVILGGGVANAGETLLEPLRKKTEELTFAAAEIGIPEIRTAEAGNDAGIIGAAMLEKYGFDRRLKNRAF